MYRIEYKKSVKKDLKDIDKPKARAILREIESLQDGIEGNANVKKLKGNNPYYRLRIGDYRVVFEILGDILVIVVIKVGHRKDVYKRLK